MLEGRQYNRGVRLHKLMYESIVRVIWRGFEEWLKVRDEEFFAEYESHVREVLKEALIENF